MKPPRTPVALSLTGSGCLLLYQLGACQTLLAALASASASSSSSSSSVISIQQVAGSSGGAIVAALIAHKCCLKEFASDFLASQGQGLTLLRSRLGSCQSMPLDPTLSVCTTHCKDGKLREFQFSNSADVCLLPAIEASCRIPISFHPWDVLSSYRSYDESEGVNVNGEYFVDGGIAAPAPPTKPNLQRIVISPLSGRFGQDDWHISPSDYSAWPTISIPFQYQPHASLGNLRALRTAVGLTSAKELNSWYQKGQDDANRFLGKF
jgi:predicted acylesterase/phospholipase RssA